MVQAFFWISFRLFPTLPPALLTGTATDAVADASETVRLKAQRCYTAPAKATAAAHV